MTPENPLYINHAQSKMEDSITQGGYNPLEAVYAYDPVPAILDEKQASFILGAQGNLWSEYISNEKKLEYMLFPRISALSEVLWSPKINRNWNNFEKRLPGLMERYTLWGVQYSTAFYDLQPTVQRGKNGFPAWKLDSKLPDAKINYVKDSSNPDMQNYTEPIEIRHSGTFGATITDKNKRIKERWIWQTFNINKATGKKVSLLEEPNKSYSLGGAFSLVDGIQNETGMIRSAQFLGFNGRDMVATIDMGKPTRIKSVTLHAFEQTGSWIYRPAELSFQYSRDGKNYVTFRLPVTESGTKNLEYQVKENIKARWIRIKAKNPGMIKDGLPGAGHRAWIFFDEIVID
jgi:hexosaminidase